MNTPTGRRRAARFNKLYGEDRLLINRRAALVGLTLAAAVPALAAGPIRSVAWRGRATVTQGTRTLQLMVETRLQLPLLRVRSTSWIVERGPASARTMILEPHGQWLEMGDTRLPLPVQLGIHERQQYAIYAWLVMIQQAARAPGRLPLKSPPYPDITFEIGADGFPVSADLMVDAAEIDRPPIVEHVTFHGRLEFAGLRWPRRFVMTQNGQPYLTLDIESFEANA